MIHFISKQEIYTEYVYVFTIQIAPCSPGLVFGISHIHNRELKLPKQLIPTIPLTSITAMQF